jgi:hypothetical protein
MQSARFPLGPCLLILWIAVAFWMANPTSLTSPPASASPADSDLTSLPPCNSPWFLKKIQDLAEKTHAAELRAGAISNGLVLRIQSTTTLGQMGNFNSCSMAYDHGSPDSQATYNYLIGRNDSGDIVWRSSDQPPFEFIPLAMLPGEHQYP